MYASGVSGKYEVEFYRTERGDSPVDEFLDGLEKRHRAKADKWLVLLEEAGPFLPRPYADVLEGPIRELRIGFGRLEARLLHFVHDKKIVVVTHGFLKKTRKVDQAEIEKAMKARTDWLSRFGGKS